MAYVRAYLTPAAGPAAYAPHVYEASLHVRLKMNPLARLLCWLRPEGLTWFLIAAAGVALAAGGTTGAHALAWHAQHVFALIF